MRVTWLGHATVLLELDGVRVLTDPVLLRRVGPLHNTTPVDPHAVADVDVVLISHVHRDHLDLPSLRVLHRTRVVVPVGAGGLVDGRHDVEELAVGASAEVGSVTVTAVPAVHHAARNPFGRPVPAVGHVVRGARTAYVAGDTEVFPEMATIADGGLDLALLPVGGWGPSLGPGHMDPAEAAQALTLLRPKVAVPVHWGTLRAPLAWRLRPDRYALPGQEFAALARDVAPHVDVRVVSVSETLILGG